MNIEEAIACVQVGSTVRLPHWGLGIKLGYHPSPSRPAAEGIDYRSIFAERSELVRTRCVMSDETKRDDWEEMG